MQDILSALLDWRIILISIILLIAFPVIFYLSSLDKTPVKIKRIKMKAVTQKTEGSAESKMEMPQKERRR